MLQYVPFIRVLVVVLSDDEVASRNTHLPVLAIVAAALVLGALVVWQLRGRFSRHFVVDEAEIGIGTHKLKIKPSYEDSQIAFQLWVEMVTRKIAIPIDPDHDVIADVYGSWYEFFRLARERIGSVPVRSYRRSESTRAIVEVSIRMLNDVLRPHLTKWQARFRRWWDVASKDDLSSNREPQELQKEYPHYDELVADALDVSTRLAAFADMLHGMARGDR